MKPYGCIVPVSLFAVTLVVCFAIKATVARGADLPLPDVIVIGPETMQLNRFGTYSDAYYSRRWKRLCQGGGRYQAMAEAYERYKPDPCNGAKVWIR